MATQVPRAERPFGGASAIPEPTIGNLIEEITSLLGKAIILENSEAKALLEHRVQQIGARNGMEPLGRRQQEFYNFSLNILDSEGRINAFCLSQLQRIDLGGPIEDDESYEAYRLILNKKQQVENLQSRITTLEEKLERYMTMVPINPINLEPINGIHHIPTTIPPHATHVLVYSQIYSGCCSKTVNPISVSNSLNHKYQIYSHYYAQGAISYNSEHLWIQICPKREITISGFKKEPNSGAKFIIIAYK